MKKVISTDNAPAAIGPYSQAIEVNGMVFTSGIIPVDPKTGVISDGSVEQAKQAFLNLKNLFILQNSNFDKNIFIAVKTSTAPSK